MSTVLGKEIQISTHALIITYLGWILLGIASFFFHTRGLLWVGYGLFFTSILYILIKNFSLLTRYFFSKTFILIFLFLLMLILFVILSAYPLTSFESFLLDYFFNITLFLFFYVLSLKDEFFKKGKVFFYILGIVSFLVFFYYLFFVFFRCNFSLQCLLFSSIAYLEDAKIKTNPMTVPLVFTATYFVAKLSEEKNKILKFVHFILFLSPSLFLLYTGRRAALMALSISLFLALFLVKNKKIKKVILWGFSILLIFIVFLAFSPYGKKIFIENRDNLALLFSKNPEDWPKAGSMGLRLHFWSVYIKMSLENPFSGTGLGRKVQKLVLSARKPSDLCAVDHGHNLFLNLALQAGWPTALIFLLFYLLTLRESYHFWRRTEEHPLVLGLFLFLLAFFIMAQFEGFEKETSFTYFWVASGMVWGLSRKFYEGGLLS